MKVFSGEGTWGLKLLARILAIVIYFAMRDALRDGKRDASSLIINGGPANAAAR